MSNMSSQITGDQQSYTISDNIKKYSLKDVGFIENNHGSLVYNRPIGDSPYDAKFKLKVSVSKNLDNLKMAVTDLTGIKNIDISKLKNSEEMIKMYQYILDDFVDRDILIKN